MDFIFSPSFSTRVEELMAQNHVPGLAITVVHNKKTASASYGKASLDPEVPCSADTLFDIASCAKVMTALAVGMLVEDNEQYPDVQYDALMSRLLPDDFVMPSTEYTEGVTLDDVLGHRTGTAAHSDSILGVGATEPDTARSITRNLRNLPVVAPLRSRYLYSNMMYTVATHLVEVKSQQNFASFLEDRLFQPLGMSSSSLQPSAAIAKGFEHRMASGHVWDEKSEDYKRIPHQECPEGQGAGSVITSSGDFAKLIKALLARSGPPISNRVYQGTVRMRSFPRSNPAKVKAHTSPSFYAAGVEVYYYRGCTVIGHDGHITGFGSRFFILPDFNFGAIILGNSSGAASVASIVARELIDEVLKIPQADRPPRTLTTGAKGTSKDERRNSAKKSPSQESPWPLITYVGRYWNPGYHYMTVEIKDDGLFINASDRSPGFTLTLQHDRDGTKYKADLVDLLENDVADSIDAEFTVEDGVAVKLGLDLEPSLKSLIRFSRV